MVKLFKALPALLFATFAAADLQITNPSAELWWVGKSQNVMAWNCNQNTEFSNFTVLINNQNPAILLGPLAFIAIQNNFDCSVTVSQDQVDQPPGSGYLLIFANPLNNTDVYATSDPFEIKPLGSLYPSQISSSSSVAGTGTAAPSASSTSTSHSGALGAHSQSFIGLAGLMGLITAGLLWA